MVDYIRTADVPRDLPLPVIQVLAGCKALEQSDGSWNGGDVVDFLTSWLTGYGLDVEQPLSHYVRAAGPDDVLYPGVLPNLPVLRTDVETALANEDEWADKDHDYGD